MLEVSLDMVAVAAALCCAVSLAIRIDVDRLNSTTEQAISCRPHKLMGVQT